MYVIKLPLKTKEYQISILDKRFFAINRLHNVLVSHCKKLQHMVETNHRYKDWLEEYRKLNKIEEPTPVQAARKTSLKKSMTYYRNDIGFSRGGLEKYAKVWQKANKHLVTSQQAQAEVANVWQGAKSVLFSKGKEIHYRKISDTHSIGGKSNKNGVVFDINNLSVSWLGENIPCKVNLKDNYIKEALFLEDKSKLNISYCFVSREAFSDGWHYYANIVIDGISPSVREHPAGDAVMGVDPGISTFAGVSDSVCILEELAPDVMKYNKKISSILRKMDKSRRASNPDNYNTDGTVKKKADRKPWKNSKYYNHLLWKLRETYRKKHAYVTQSHNILANKILAHTSGFFVEKNNFAAMARKSKKAAERSKKKTTIKKKNGTTIKVNKYKKKKRLGRSVNNRSPAGFVSILKRKAEAAGGTWIYIDARKFKASQYRHDKDCYEKVPLKQRTKTIDNHEVQRDLYSAFLLLHTSEDGTHPIKEACILDFKKFCSMQDDLINSMKANGISMKQCFGF